ncbi:MAG: head maturation protease, ClpP-related, partial [Desulfotomaculales bacterium]
MKKKFWQFRAAADDPKIGELLLYGIISDYSWWGDEVTPKQFKADLDAMGDVDEIRVFINSDGGDIFAGQAIYSMLKRHKAKVTVYIDGLAASMASVVAMAGDVVRMPKNAMMMIHNPWTIAVGNADDFRKLADDMDKIRESLIVAYQDKSGLEREKIIEMMDAETWMTAEEAVELGFADEIEKAKKLAASVSDGRLLINGLEFDLRRFKNPPKLDFLPKFKAGVVPSDVSREKAPEDEPWEAPTLSDFTDESWDDLSDTEKRRIAGHHAWAKAMPPEKFGDLKLPHHRPSDGAVVWRGVANAAARLPQSDIPDEDVPKVQAHLGSHYRQFDRTPPWEEQENAWREYVQVSRILRDHTDLDLDLAARWLAL